MNVIPYGQIAVESFYAKIGEIKEIQEISFKFKFNF